ncbi:MAG: hypothetical protein SOV73_03245 [Candidatus Faecivivens sp.]|nr:hypothetical protein [Candidatus Faecivivens sp.]
MTASEKAAEILRGIGVEPEESLLTLAAEGAEEELKALLHTAEIPDGLTLTASRLTAGKYLQAAAGSGRLQTETLDLSAPFVTSLKMGDTQETFDAGDSARERLDRLTRTLLAIDDRLIYRYRRLP